MRELGDENMSQIWRNKKGLKFALQSKVQDLYIYKNVIDALNFDLRSKFICDDLFELGNCGCDHEEGNGLILNVLILYNYKIVEGLFLGMNYPNLKLLDQQEFVKLNINKGGETLKKLRLLNLRSNSLKVVEYYVQLGSEELK